MASNIDALNEIILNYNCLTKTEMQIADYVLDHKQDIPQLTINELSAACGVSDGAVTRFCHKLLDSSFNDFKLSLARTSALNTRIDKEVQDASDTDIYSEVKSEDSIEMKCKKLCNIGIQALGQACELLSPQSVTLAVELLYKANNVYCYGQGNSSIMAMEAWGRFTSVASKFHWIPDAHIQADIASLLGKRDVILYFSFSGATRELIEVGTLLHNTQAKLILVTRYPNASGANLADLVLLCGANESPRQQGSIAARIGQLFIIDVLYNEYCSRDSQLTLRNKNKTLSATVPKLL